jgi:hypothetical protein
LGQVYWTRGEPIAPDLVEAAPNPERDAEPPVDESDHDVRPVFDPQAPRHKPPPIPPSATGLPDEPPF